MEISNITIYTGLAVNGIFTGLGATVGTFLANHGIIKSIKGIKKWFK